MILIIQPVFFFSLAVKLLESMCGRLYPLFSPPVGCPFQWLIYGPHKCARDAEISEEVINRTKPRKRGGKRKRTEEVTGTYGVKARAWERKRERETERERKRERER